MDSGKPTEGRRSAASRRSGFVHERRQRGSGSSHDCKNAKRQKRNARQQPKPIPAHDCRRGASSEALDSEARANAERVIARQVPGRPKAIRELTGITGEERRLQAESPRGLAAGLRRFVGRIGGSGLGKDGRKLSIKEAAGSVPNGPLPAAHCGRSLPPLVNLDCLLRPHAAHAPVVVVRPTGNNDGQHGTAAAKAPCRR